MRLTQRPVLSPSLTLPRPTAAPRESRAGPHPATPSGLPRPAPNQIGEIDSTTGAITEFPIPTANSGTTAITLGSDGSLWFTETNANQIGGINPTTSAFTEFNITTTNSGPSGIVNSPSGSLWFTEASANQIGRFVNVFPTSHNVIEGNIIGLNAQGTGVIPNSDSGVVINQADNNTIGGTAADSGNVISGNLLYGVLISSGGSDNAIDGNFIGTAANGDGASGLGNTADGVFLLGGNPTDQNQTVTQNIVYGNFIAGNASNGIQIFGQGSTANLVSSNLIGLGVNDQADQNLGNGVFLNDAGPNNTIGSGNIIAGNAQSGIMILSDEPTFDNGSLVVGNLIGTNAANSPNIGNGANGIFIYGSSANTIGGTAGAAANVISGNNQSGVVILTPAASAPADRNELLGNFIGTNTGGNAAVPNQSDGIEIINSEANVVGPNNVISGNLGNGVLIESLSTAGTQLATGNLVFGNRIGTDATGANVLSNGENGVLLSNAVGNIIGLASGYAVSGTNIPILASNVISGNGQAGIQFFGDSPSNVVQGNYIGLNEKGSALLRRYDSRLRGLHQ